MTLYQVSTDFRTLKAQTVPPTSGIAIQRVAASGLLIRSKVDIFLFIMSQVPTLVSNQRLSAMNQSLFQKGMIQYKLH